ncbi:conserved exported hypothetical protein [Cupriavidus taiwanensis]|uniref:Lipoprotein n=1 Tax=Cupriavidus taiwanensis TaxID=164546 RepID=A0A976B0G8_9BURK|nr:hypothetical protein [Cupriavidus taiwanensis]SOZ63386.1 conserved exported hypothetical protein [Cupriavidus taiwanensis]SOZ64386.1 conserved exported hypothetical protein [Cupriavidus taiwanensis]SOZ68124.1 conserved exported hypothetical protein [Cupriavidus taiwanensis]SPA07936.1 conserved exported hypothetical protein [Cupriavidus taiwanensis]
MDARIQRRLRACIGAMMLAPMGAAFGAMEDALLSAEPVGPAARGYYAEPAYDVGSHYQGGHLRLGYKLSPAWSLEAGYWRRHVSHGDDSAGIDSWLASTSYGLISTPDAGRKLTLRLSAWGNYTGSLRKSGAMPGNKLADYSIAHPNDTQVQADLIYTGRPWPGQALTGFISGGYSWVRAGDIQGTLKQGSCLYNVRVSADNMATGTLAAPCRMGRATVPSGSFRLNAADLGVDAGNSFNDSGAFIGAGGSWRWGHGAWSLTAGYHVQYFFRELDNRYMAYGSARTQFNQTVLLQASYAINRHVDVFVRGQGAQNSLMGYVPLLYNPVTASRLDRTYGLFSLGLRISGF